jgi:hypothetical protein
MARIPNTVIERLKAEVSVERLGTSGSTGPRGQVSHVARTGGRRGQVSHLACSASRRCIAVRG